MKRTPGSRTFLELPSFLVALLLLGAPALRAQEAAQPPSAWSFETEVGANVFFGATDQTTVSAAAGIDWKGSRFELENDLSYLYGEASDDTGATFVNKRSWLLGSTLNYRGFTWVNPFAFATVLSSLEKAIDHRYKGGLGAKLTAVDSETTRFDLSLGFLGEKTVQEDPENGTSDVLIRWDAALGFRRAFSGERTIFEAKADYSPVFDDRENYTVTAEAGIAFRLSEIVRLKLSVVDNYDSQATDRGARDNNDGQVLFAVLASF